MTLQESCAHWLPLLAEPAAVVTVDGRFMLTNDAFSRLISFSGPSCLRLSDLLADDQFDLTRQLRRWAGSKQPLPASMRLHTSEGRAELVIEGGRLSPADTDGEPVALLIRCRRKAEAVTRFRILGEKMDALSREVMARRRAEQQAVEQRERLRITLGSIGDAVLATDTQGRVTFMNPVAEALTGWPLEEAFDRDSLEVFDIVNEETRQPVESPVTRVLREGAIVGLANHTVLLCRDGREIPIDDSGAPIRDFEGQLIGTVLVFRDISERYAADYAQARLAAVVRNSTDAIIAQRLDGTVTQWNPAAAATFGYTEPEMIGHSITKMTPEDRQQEELQIQEAIRHGRAVQHFETKRRHKDGRLLDISLSVSPITDAYDRVSGIGRIARDITPQKQVEQALKESETRERERAAELEALMDSVPAVVFVAHDPDCRRITGNRKAYEFYRLPPGSNLSKDPESPGVPATFRVFQHNRELSADELPAQRAARGEHVDHEEFEVRFDDGEVGHLFGTAIPLHDECGRIRGSMAALIDITVRRQAERELQRLNKELERRVDERTAQLRELAHQLTRAEQKERQRIAQALHDNLQQLLVAARMRAEFIERRSSQSELLPAAKEVQTLINQVIEASRALTLELSPPVLRDGGLCAALAWLGRQMEEKYGLKVTLHADSAAEPQDEEIRFALFLAARELLFNTVKHARADRAEVGLRIEGGDIRLNVHDTGRGFDSQAAARSEDGTAFGLFSLRERIAFMGGRVNIDSAPGQGARIEIVTPQRSVATGTPASQRDLERIRQAQLDARPAHRPIIRVLLADDHKILREGIAEILREYPDLELVAEAADGQEAVELTAQHQPDVVIMDITMPRLSGIEATRLIRQQMPYVQIVGLSMHNSESMAQALAEAGALRMLVKDGPSDELVKAIREAASRRA